MLYWKLTGIIATLVIILSIPLYLIQVKSISPRGESEPHSTFVGSLKCMDCHKNEFDKWKGSHHDHAMHVADDLTVLGDFNNAVFENHGIRSRFYRKGGKLFVKTLGPDGKMGEFEITHTFGWFPLQQYLVPFPGGRLQCLPIAWDVRDKKWYHLYPDLSDPKDWLYWTRAGQNWNGMCAECHSTNLKKNYDPETDTYNTTWSDINVGCEACHGPGSSHVAWAETPDMGRPRVDNFDLAVKTSGLDSRALVELCAPCHSRRAALGDYTHAEPDLLDSLLPSLLTPELYFPDGQILDEVYVYGSFTQSKMYHRDVRCSDCHDVHSLKLIREGNELCLQCHRTEEYDTREHHFHKKKGEAGEPIKSADGKVLFDIGTGAECVQCHMPGRTYMGIDYRPDHSLRIPRPDLSTRIGTPNACNRCHADKTAEWSNEYITKWYGPGRRPHYGTIIQASRNRMPGAARGLTRLALDPLYPVIVRATALSLLSVYPREETTRAYEIALMDDEALIRRTAIESLNVSDLGRQVELISPLLYDPVKAVRIEAASKLAGEPSNLLDANQRRAFQTALDEFVASMDYSGDFAFGCYNLGNLYTALNRPTDAVRNYQAAIQIDDLFYPAKVNLAMLYNQQSKNMKAERLLREVVQAYPHMYEVQYSLGLLLGEQNKYEEAGFHLSSAARGLPKRSRIQYNLGLILDYLKRDFEAEAALMRALELEPYNMDYLKGMAEYYLERKRYEEARHMAEQMIAKHPSNSTGHRMLDFIKRKQRKSD
jgi:Flp pilus assembly protein TadD